MFNCGLVATLVWIPKDFQHISSHSYNFGMRVKHEGRVFLLIQKPFLFLFPKISIGCYGCSFIRGKKLSFLTKSATPKDKADSSGKDLEIKLVAQSKNCSLPGGCPETRPVLQFRKRRSNIRAIFVLLRLISRSSVWTQKWRVVCFLKVLHPLLTVHQDATCKRQVTGCKFSLSGWNSREAGTTKESWTRTTRTPGSTGHS